MLKILDEWINDLPWQFQNKSKINILLTALARQLDEVEQMFSDLNTMTDICSAVGENLDKVGTIIPLTRMEASKMSGSVNVIDDETYRKLLRLTMAKNINDCTYSDIVIAFGSLTNATSIKYVEPENQNATIELKIKGIVLSKENEWVFNYPVIKAAGVKLKITPDFDDNAKATIYLGSAVERMEDSTVSLDLKNY